MVINTNDNNANKWEIEEDFRTLQRAREICKDERRLDRVKNLIKEQEEALKDLSSDKFYKSIGLGE